MPENGVIIYLGRFEMPDKDATAHRVFNNGLLFRKLGYQVVFVGWNHELPWSKSIGEPKPMAGFDCWELAKPESVYQQWYTMTDATRAKHIIRQYQNVKMLILYNYPAIALQKLLRFCRKERIKCVADITEWYGNGTKNIMIQLARAFDTSFRMRFLHKKMDGHIVISEFLRNYYMNCNIKTILLPPLINLSDRKWGGHVREMSPSTCLTFVFAGKPYFQKERLDLFVKALISIHHNFKLQLKIIGVSKAEFYKIYPPKTPTDYLGIDEVVTFIEQLNHAETLQHIQAADYSIVIRDSNRITQAGFSTKFVESISCGTPVITTNTSDVKNYISNGINGCIISLDHISEELASIAQHPIYRSSDRSIFDYRNFMIETNIFLNAVLNNFHQ